MQKILFVCTHNRCRSILCEAITRHLAGHRIAAFSAGSQPSGEVHPDTLQHLARRGIDTVGLRSESWDVYADLSPGVVITVCDQAAGESCPLWLGQALKVHWGLPDPSRVDESAAVRAEAFDRVIQTIEGRISLVLGLDLKNLSGTALRAELDRIAISVP